MQNTTRVFGYDTGGEIVQKRSGTLSGSTFTPSGGGATDHYTYAEGQELSVLDEAGDISALTALTGFSDGPGTQGYVVQAGDTLASIAQAVYGNGQLGYLIAQANGFSGDGDLVQGQSITVPSVTTSSNSATTFKPYNASAIVGSTTPTLPTAPPPPPPSSHGCSTFAEILVVAVTVVAAFYTAGAAGDAGWGYLASGAAAGAAGSTAGQLAGDVLGVHQGFDLGEVAQGAVGGAIGGELSGTFSQGGALADTFSSTVGNGINPLGNALIGASSYGGTYETAKITGEAAHFSWAGLVADAAGSAAGGEFGSTSAQTAAGLQDGFSASQVAARAVQDVVTRETSRALGDDHTQSWQQIGEDVFGNALGNAAVGTINAAQARSAEQAASFSSQASSEWNQDQTAIGTGAGGWTQGSGESAFEQEAQTLMAASPRVASADAYSAYTGIYGLPADEGNGAGGAAPGQGDVLGINPSSFADQLDMLDDDADRLAMANGGNLIPRYNLAIDTGAVGPAIEPPYLPPIVTSLAGSSVTASAAAGYLSMMYADPSESPGLLTYDFSEVDQSDSAAVGGSTGTHQATPDTIWRSAYDAVQSAEAFQLQNPSVSDPLTLGALSLTDKTLVGVGNVIASWSALFNKSNNNGLEEGVNPFTDQALWGIDAQDARFQSLAMVATMGVGVEEKGLTEAISVRNTGATSIGNSGYASVQNFSDAAYTKYQGFVDDGFTLANQAWDDGVLTASSGVSKNTTLGSYTDRFARDAMR